MRNNQIALHVPYELVFCGKAKLDETEIQKVREKMDAVFSEEAAIAAAAVANQKGAKAPGGKQQQAEAEELTLKNAQRVEEAIRAANEASPLIYKTIALPEAFSSDPYSFILDDEAQENLSSIRKVIEILMESNISATLSLNSHHSENYEKAAAANIEENSDVWIFPPPLQDAFFQTGSMRLAGCSKGDGILLNDKILSLCENVIWIGDALFNEKEKNVEVGVEDEEWRDRIKSSRLLLRAVEQRGNAEGAYDDEEEEDEDWMSEKGEDDDDNDDDDEKYLEEDDDGNSMTDSKARISEKKKISIDLTPLQKKLGLPSPDAVSIKNSIFIGGICDWLLNLCREGHTAVTIMDKSVSLNDLLSKKGMSMYSLTAIDKSKKLKKLSPNSL
eukprot:GDKJ01059322.1.p1 GENE.GDKJ01059322.1~~GDKJ01059322.1.p1  ORF type:complete len:421 (-),score=138.54 GDKJ01059322.1:56-1219(-)